MNRAQVQKAIMIFLDEHDKRCPTGYLATTREERSPDVDGDLTELTCAACGAAVIRTREGDDWNATWHWRDHDAIEHPDGCFHERRAHTHDEHGDVQLALVP